MGHFRLFEEKCVEKRLFWCGVKGMKITIDEKKVAAFLDVKEPWFVRGIEFDMDAGQVVVKVGCDRVLWCNTQRQLHVHGWATRRWRHLDAWGMRTFIEAEVPRVRNPATGKTGMVAVPWAGRYERVTKGFESWAIEVLLASGSIESGRKILRCGWEACDRIIKRGVERGIVRRDVEGVRLVGIDEKSFGKGQDYVSLMVDLTGKRVLEVVEGAGQKEVEELWGKLLGEGRQGRCKVEAAAMGRGAAMVAGTREAAPEVVIVHDRYHVSAELNKIVDEVRRAEARKLAEQGDETLKGSRYLWLKGVGEMSEEVWEQFQEKLSAERKTSRAWVHKETFAEFWNQEFREAGEAFFKIWYGKAVRSRIKPVVKVAKGLKGSLPELLNYFEYRITNAMTEGFNGAVGLLKSAARGFRSFESYRARILFFCGKLDMKPS